MTTPKPTVAALTAPLVAAPLVARSAALLLAMTACASVASSPAPARAPAAAAAAAPTAVPLAARIAQRIAEVPGARVGVAYRALDGSDTLYLHADTAFHAASTMKVPVMIEVFRQADAGRLALDAPQLLRNEFRSIVDGSPYRLDAGDDSDSTLYARVGSPVPLRELVERMITRSSNLATNFVIELVTPAAVQRLQAALGAPELRVLRGVEDGKAYAAGLSNTTTARALATTLAALQQGRAASPAATRAMLDILLRQEHNDQIPAGLPPGTPVAHKTGSITATLHDAAIVYPPEQAPYVLVVLTGNIPDPAQARALTADIARLVHAHHVGR